MEHSTFISTSTGQHSTPRLFNYLVSTGFGWVVLLVGALSSILSSPKWNVALFAWISPVCFLYFYRVVNVRKRMLIFLSVLTISIFVGTRDVIPFPLPVLIMLSILESIKALLVYMADRWIMRFHPGFLSCLFFPAAMVSLEFLGANLSGGAWGSLANSQFPFKWLIQLASVTGIWGISFMIYWVASVLVWGLNQRINQRPYKFGVLVCGLVLGLVLFFGAIRFHIERPKGQRLVRVAGVSVPLMEFLQALYKDYSGNDVNIDPKISIASKQLQTVNQAQIPFIERADTIQFARGYAALEKAIDSLFKLSQDAADRGAKIICWSEANAMVFPFGEKQLTDRGRAFAKRNRIYLQMAVAVIHPGKIYAGRKFLENKALLFSPAGELLNIFHKNNPVPMAEASNPGDGRIPFIQTPYGRISTSICYDADFPIQMQQLGRQASDLLLLPSGDWYAISPYHSYMALFRGIENGNSIVRQVSGGLSVASDYRGKIYASMDFYGPTQKIWVADLPIGHQATVYNVVGDAVAYLSILYSLGCMIIVAIHVYQIRKRKTVSIEN